MAEELEKAHLYYDDINMIRVLEAPVLKQTIDLHDQAKEYTESYTELIQILDSLLAMQDELVADVERHKMAAIGAVNALKSVARERDSLRAKLQGEISEKTVVLEQLDAELHSLRLAEAAQRDTLEYLTHM